MNMNTEETAQSPSGMGIFWVLNPECIQNMNAGE